MAVQGEGFSFHSGGSTRCSPLSSCPKYLGEREGLAPRTRNRELKKPELLHQITDDLFLTFEEGFKVIA